MWTITVRTLLELGAIRRTLTRQHQLLLAILVTTSAVFFLIMARLEFNSFQMKRDCIIGKSSKPLGHHAPHHQHQGQQMRQASWLLTDGDPWTQKCQPLLDHLSEFQNHTIKSQQVQEKTPLVFLKTHKTGSSTVQNILLRYGASNDLTFVMPKSDNYFYCQQEVPRELQPCWSEGEADIFCLHTDCITKEGIQRRMKNGSFWFTILRHPDAVFESIYRYFMMYDATKLGMSFAEFASSPPKLDVPLVFPDRPIYVGANQMIRDLGLPIDKMDDPTAIKTHLQYLKSTYDFVMISEHMEESLILFRHKIGLSLEEILVLDVNKRVLGGESTVYQNLSREQKLNLMRINRADHMLYKLFLKKFHSDLKEFGNERMETELQAYKCLKKAMYDKCKIFPFTGDLLPIMYKPGYHGDYIRGYFPALTQSDDSALHWHCNRLAYSEMPHVDIVRLQQRIRVAKRCHVNLAVG